MTLDSRLLTTGGNGLVNKVMTNYGDKLKEVMGFAMENFSDIKLNREDFAKAKGVDPDDVTRMELIEDVLRHFDTNEIAKNNPEVASTTWKTVSLIAGLCTPYAVIPAAIVNFIPDKHAAKVVEYSGILTPSHLIRTGLKSRMKKSGIRPSSDTGRLQPDVSLKPELTSDLILDNIESKELPMDLAV